MGLADEQEAAVIEAEQIIRSTRNPTCPKCREALHHDEQEQVWRCFRCCLYVTEYGLLYPDFLAQEEE